ncbi:MAG: hypothetical protein LBG87_07860 [Spirochaetaceae bacterium]|nr:hypothetical protein [Spirochaetaceae bacterium]
MSDTRVDWCLTPACPQPGAFQEACKQRRYSVSGRRGFWCQTLAGWAVAGRSQSARCG